MTQEEALNILKTGANVFLTGEPGSGKTHIVNRYIDYLRSYGVEPAITASTGIAATHIGGLTIHSWCGIGVRRALTKYDLDYISQKRKVAGRVGGAKVLIVDEVSMLSSRVLSMVDAVCREVRQSRESFGGLQVILVGDFFQLPPVSAKNEEGKQSFFGSEEFSYSSAAWAALRPIVCYLSEQHRQEDPIFLELLSAIRKGNFKEGHLNALRGRYFPAPKSKIPQLYSHNDDVDKINALELGKLRGEEKIFKMQSRGAAHLVLTLKRGCLSPENLALKTGAQVMFTKNDTAARRYVNGTLGMVAGFSKRGGYPVIKTIGGKTIFAEPEEWRLEEGGRALARIIQLPLRLAWAMTVHKSQGMSLDAAHMDLSRVFEYGQGYVALSRVRTLSGLSLAGFNARAVEVHPEIRVKDREFRGYSELVKNKFASIGKEEITKMHFNFIRACGGRPRGAQEEESSHRNNSAEAARAGSTYEVTRVLLQEGKTLEEIAEARGLKVSTVISHIEKLLSQKKIDMARDLAHIGRPEQFEKIKLALETVYKKEGRMLLSPAMELLGNSCNYEDLRLARLFLQ